MGRGMVRQRHQASCPRDIDGTVLPHRCRASWTYVLDVGPTATGHRRQITRSGFPTRAVATSALDEMRRQVGDGIDDQRLTTGEYLEQWLKGKRALRPSTLKSARELLDTLAEELSSPVAAATRTRRALRSRSSRKGGGARRKANAT